jgi:hypothetical protein
MLRFALLLLCSLAHADVTPPSSDALAGGVFACANWMAATGQELYWSSQHGDFRGIWRQPLAGGPAVRGAVQCAGQLLVSDERMWCVEDHALVTIGKNARRIDLPGSVDHFAADGGAVVVSDDTSVLRIDGAGPANIMSLVKNARAVAAGGGSTFWLAADGALWGNGHRLSDTRCMAKHPTRCELAADATQVYVLSDARCGSHDPCPRSTAALERFSHDGKPLTALANNLRMATHLRQDDKYVYFANSIEGVLYQVGKSGKPPRTIPAMGAYTAFAVGKSQIYWFDSGGQRLDWTDCHLKSAPK